MQKSKCLILFFLVSFCRLSLAQDTGNFTQFFFNPYSFNSSFAGIEGRGALFLAYRNQWSGIEGSPTIANLSYHGPVGNRLSLGINVANDKRGLLTTSGGYVTLGYSIPLGAESFLRFGISGGASSNTVDLDKLQSQNIGNDPALINLLNQTATVIGNAGLSLHIKSFHIGAALPNLFSPTYVSEDAFTVSEVKPFESIVVHASNRIYFADKKHIFEPYAVYRINNGLPSQYEFAGVFHISHVVWLGGSYKEEFGISFLGGFKINNKFALGASYTLKNTGENELNFPSYEIQLSLLPGSSKSKSKSKSKDSKPLPLYSFVNTEIPKKTRTELMNDNYAEAIAKADKAFSTKNYELARLEYYEAQKFKPSENYPKTKIAEIDKLLAYDSKLKMANNEFAAKKYEQALTDYEAASALRPNEQYPKDKIAEIKALLTPKIIESDSDKKYREAITKGDLAMASKNYEDAKLAYTDALKIKPTEVYPKLQITEAQKAISYQSNIRKADGEFSTRSYAEALNDYQAASQLYPDEQYPKDQIAKINALIAKVPVQAPERHETVKRGVNAQELKPGNYVIIGVFGSATNARNLTRQVVESGINANYGFLTEKNLWYVHVFDSDDINTTRAERNKHRNDPKFKNAWLLTVEN
jgi:type IX secretion system PorP/SprF family membrane protein